jgi:hypothetical protein
MNPWRLPLAVMAGQAHISLRAMTQLQKTLTAALLAATLPMAGSTVPALAQAYPDPLAAPSQSSAVIQQQNLGTQYNALQLQQNMTTDRLREQQLFTPQPLYGANTQQPPLGANNPAFQPLPSDLPPRPQQATAIVPTPPAPVATAELPPRPKRAAPPQAPVPTAQ